MYQSINQIKIYLHFYGTIAVLGLSFRERILPKGYYIDVLIVVEIMILLPHTRAQARTHTHTHTHTVS